MVPSRLPSICSGLESSFDYFEERTFVGKNDFHFGETRSHSGLLLHGAERGHPFPLETGSFRSLLPACSSGRSCVLVACTEGLLAKLELPVT